MPQIYCHLYWQAPKSDICIDRIIRLIGMVLVLATTALIWGQSNHNGEGITMSAVGHHQCFQLMFRRQTTPRRGSTQRQICCQHRDLHRLSTRWGLTEWSGHPLNHFSRDIYILKTKLVTASSFVILACVFQMQIVVSPDSGSVGNLEMLFS